ncbi:alpha/beta fold hydrolase [Tsukamurella strandjordii]|uniref:Alpha/beta hydrolase n=1 Tax=Tsukamurella strandjordii TaxID=147577 RepID=A0AA90NLT1_9ACTN|nr:alpha/beta hydrolase [Tsukamurella strandjordii]MDP0396814.1 alpha/beta hydrolase [Tsukamurella strandjordii]
MTRACGFAVGPDGTEIFYIDYSTAYAGTVDPTKPAYLLIHGWSASGDSWGLPLIDELTAAGHRVVAVDNRGHGRSSVPASFTTQEFADDVKAVRDRLGLDEVYLVGWSYGGLIIADHLSVHGTDGVLGVGLIGAITSIGGGKEGQFPGGVTGPAMNGALPAALSAKPSTAIPALASIRMLPKGFDQETLGPVAQRVFGHSLSTPPAVRGGLFRRTVDHDADLAAWTFPVLIQHGRDDEVVAPVTAEHHAAVLPHSTLSWWDGGGHAPFVVDPARCARELLDLRG